MCDLFHVVHTNLWQVCGGKYIVISIISITCCNNAKDDSCNIFISGILRHFEVVVTIVKEVKKKKECNACYKQCCMSDINTDQQQA